MKRASALLALTLAAGCGAGGGVRVEGPAPTVQRARPVYVIAYMGDALQRPRDFALTEFSGMTDVRWKSWGQASAVGEGKLSGSWCIPKCDIPATITLTRLQWMERTGYYSRFTVTTDRQITEADLVNQKLEVPPR
ncbi:hypothetical protein [Nonomuraea typhae]|uniref:Lipoprotein n=1 Tax=Nonomuraea typhae TaxID=2603600 RepID=A0ABW7Z1S5_9ACTN